MRRGPKNDTLLAGCSYNKRGREKRASKEERGQDSVMCSCRVVCRKSISVSGPLKSPRPGKTHKHNGAE